MLLCCIFQIEDEIAAEKALKFLPSIIKIVKHWECLCKRKRLQNKSYENLLKHHSDKLIPLKLQFFKNIASHSKGFLETFQPN